MKIIKFIKKDDFVELISGYISGYLALIYSLIYIPIVTLLFIPCLFSKKLRRFININSIKK